MKALMAEFESGEDALRALRALRSRGYGRLKLYAPRNVAKADEALRLRRPRLLPRLVLGAAATGAGIGYLLQWYVTAVDYPLDVGGRPLHPWPSFVPITFEMAVLFGVFAAFFGLFLSGGLFRLWQPEFEMADFEGATVDRYWIGVAGEDRRSDAESTSRELEALGALRVEPLEEEP